MTFKDAASILDASDARDNGTFQLGRKLKSGETLVILEGQLTRTAEQYRT